MRHLLRRINISRKKAGQSRNVRWRTHLFKQVKHRKLSNRQQSRPKGIRRDVEVWGETSKYLRGPTLYHRGLSSIPNTSLKKWLMWMINWWIAWLRLVNSEDYNRQTSKEGPSLTIAWQFWHLISPKINSKTINVFKTIRHFKIPIYSKINRERIIWDLQRFKLAITFQVYHLQRLKSKSLRYKSCHRVTNSLYLMGFKTLLISNRSHIMSNIITKILLNAHPSSSSMITLWLLYIQRQWSSRTNYPQLIKMGSSLHRSIIEINQPRNQEIN
jgi:hypothetical protein